VNVTKITLWADRQINPNMTLNKTEPEEKLLDELSEELTRSIRSLAKKITKFKNDKGDMDCHIDSIEAIIKVLIKDLEWVMECRESNTINV